MRSETITKTKSLAGTSDLTLLAPLKAGFVPSMESVTYNTRVKRLLKTLNLARASSREYSLLRPFSDAVERVGKIHSVRVAVFEPENKLLLAATFDGAWESYIRVLWQKVGALLDVIFCNTDNYVTACDHSYEEWSEWARRVQVESNFFYGTPETTADDVRYLRNEEFVQRSLGDRGRSDLATTAQSLRPVESEAWEAIKSNGAKSGAETATQGIQGLAVLYRLTDLYYPGTDDGTILHRAACGLLAEFLRMKESAATEPENVVFQGILKGAQERYGKQLDWLFKQPGVVRLVPELPKEAPVYEKADVQGGILHTYDPLTHGCLVFMAIDDAREAADFLDSLIDDVTTDEKQSALGKIDAQTVTFNIAFTEHGLRAAGLDEAALGSFPAEFREGMSARASILGDLRTNHPRRWQLPIANWNNNRSANSEPQRVELSAIHLVVQLRTNSTATGDPDDINSASHPLYAQVAELDQAAGVRILAVQAMRRHTVLIDKEKRTVEHFGFADGESQPTIEPRQQGDKYNNQVHLGEVLIGYENEADFAPISGAALEGLKWLRNGSFLVVRKLAQNVEAVYDAAERAALLPEAQAAKINGKEILAKMMGRAFDGTPLITPAKNRNDFTYKDDPKGQACPFQAHIRRVNPRPGDPPSHEPRGRRMPRIIRSGMSYGPQYRHDNKLHSDNPKERGLVFMAYNASIGEQFEVLQRWIAGANSTGAFSGQNDPFLGVPENGRKRFFRFHHNDKIVHMELDGSDLPLEDPKPFVRLEWGMYLFVPSMTALAKIRDAARKSGAPVAVWSDSEGEQHIQRLQKMETEQCAHAASAAWKSILEDPIARENFTSASVWAAIRNRHDGVLRTPYGVLVANRALVMDVFKDPNRRYSVCGYMERMQRSIGPIYLGLDRVVDSTKYEDQAKLTNAAIQAITRQEAFSSAYTFAGESIDEFVAAAIRTAQLLKKTRWELTLDVTQVLDDVLARLCREWFGLPKSDNKMGEGSVRWDWKFGDKPTYPGHFLAPSRFMFQPQPGPKVEEVGCQHGIALKNAFVQFVEQHRSAGTVPKAPDGKDDARLSKAIFAAFPDVGQNEMLASVLVGTMIGLIPPVDGNFKLSLNEWLRDGTFWRLRSVPQLLDSIDLYDPANSPLLKALVQSMQLKPSPELVWRTAKQAHQIGNVDVKAGDRIVVSIVSSTQQFLLENSTDVFAIFGGKRDGTPQAPTHACPAYEAAMGILLGLFGALVGSKYAMQSHPVPLTLSLCGPVVQQ